jgi:hypothetical protein
MCAHPPQKSSETDEEEKRERVEAARQDETLDDEQVKRLERMHLPWRDWFENEYMQYWYWLAVLAGNLFLLLDLAQRFHVNDAPGIALLLVTFGVLVALEYKLFMRLWPEGPLSRTREKL